MAVSIILAHPTPGSFNHAIAAAAAQTLAANGYGVNLHDLFAEGFECRFSFDDFSAPSPELRGHLEEAAAAEGFVIVHPNWWGQPPALLKAWVEKTLQPGVAYRFPRGEKGGLPEGLLKARAAVVFNTSDTPAEREQKVFGDPLENIWHRCVFEFCGVNAFHRRMFGVLSDSSEAQRQGWLEEVRALVSEAFPAP